MIILLQILLSGLSWLPILRLYVPEEEAKALKAFANKFISIVQNQIYHYFNFWQQKKKKYYHYADLSLDSAYPGCVSANKQALPVEMCDFESNLCNWR